MVLLGEGGEIDFNTNINFLLEDYGISINNDVVVRPHYYKYFHPKEVVVGGGIACESMLQILLDQNKNAITPVDLIDPKFKIEVRIQSYIHSQEIYFFYFPVRLPIRSNIKCRSSIKCSINNRTSSLSI